MTGWAAKRTIAATKETADATIKATLQAADLEVTAAREQMAEQQRLALRQMYRESFAFFAMLFGAMDLLIDDVNRTYGEINLVRQSGPSSTWGPWCRNADRALSRVGFGDLRPAFVRYGGHLTSAFLRLDRDIEDVARIARIQPADGLPTPDKVEAMVRKIEVQAEALKREADIEWQRSADLLAATDVSHRELSAQPPSLPPEQSIAPQSS